MSGPFIPVNPHPYVIGQQGYGTRLIPKLGTFGMTLKVGPYNFGLTVNKMGPRFMGEVDGTGGFFGLTGYYRTYPCWGNYPIGGLIFTGPMLQFYGFTANGSGIFDYDCTMPNPFTYTAKLTAASSTAGQLALPGPNQFSPGGGAVHGKNILYAAAITGTNPPLEFVTRANFPNLTFSAVKKPLTGIQHPNSLYTEAGFPTQWNAANSHPFVIYDDFGVEFLVDYSCLTLEILGTNLLFSPGYTSLASVADGSNVGVDLLQLIHGGNFCAVDTICMGNSQGFGSTPFDFKVHPKLGSFVFAGTFGVPGTAIYTGYVWSQIQHLIGTPPIGYNCATRYVTTFGNATDNTLIQSNLANITIQQVPGGGFLLSNRSWGQQTMFLILPDLSGYYQLNINCPMTLRTFSAGQYNFDLNGNLWYLDYNILNNGFTNVYTSIGQSPPVIISQPQLNTFTASCQEGSDTLWLG